MSLRCYRDFHLNLVFREIKIIAIITSFFLQKTIIVWSHFFAKNEEKWLSLSTLATSFLHPSLEGCLARILGVHGCRHLLTPLPWGVSCPPPGRPWVPPSSFHLYQGCHCIHCYCYCQELLNICLQFFRLDCHVNYMFYSSGFQIRPEARWVKISECVLNKVA
jgi:hypothetical protein